MELHSSRQSDTRIHAQACEWFVEFRSGEPDESARRAFLAWLKESPAHMRAYLEVTALWRDTTPQGVSSQWSAEQLVREAALDRENVVSLGLSGATQTLKRHARNLSPAGRTARIALLSAAASFALFALAASVLWLTQKDIYSTDVGEQRSVSFPDGSTVQLNSRSKLRVHYTARRRQIDLLAGQALFDVARDPARPFVVWSGRTQVRAIGTQFDVYRKSEGTIVSVVQGRVAVLDRTRTSTAEQPPPDRASSSSSGTVNAGTVYLDAGEQLALSDHAPAIKRITNPVAVTAWTERQLLFESTPLGQVVQEFNRYNTRQLVLEDRTLEDFRIDGVFSSTDPSSLVRFLRSRAGVRVTETDAAILIERSKVSQ